MKTNKKHGQHTPLEENYCFSCLVVPQSRVTCLTLSFNSHVSLQRMMKCVFCSSGRKGRRRARSLVPEIKKQRQELSAFSLPAGAGELHETALQVRHPLTSPPPSKKGPSITYGRLVRQPWLLRVWETAVHQLKSSLCVFVLDKLFQVDVRWKTLRLLSSLCGHVTDSRPAWPNPNRAPSM